MPRLRLLLFDANIVIELHKIVLWEKVIGLCDVTLTKTVAEDESEFWEDDFEEKHYFNLQEEIDSGKINCITVSNKHLEALFEKFSPVYLDRLDPGEAESLAVLISSDDDWLISSSDGIVFRVLGNLGLPDQGISLAEVLQKIGLTYPGLRFHFGRDFRLKMTQQGQQEGIMGMGQC